MNLKGAIKQKYELKSLFYFRNNSSFLFLYFLFSLLYFWTKYILSSLNGSIETWIEFHYSSIILFLQWFLNIIKGFFCFFSLQFQHMWIIWSFNFERKGFVLVASKKYTNFTRILNPTWYTNFGVLVRGSKLER